MPFLFSKYSKTTYMCMYQKHHRHFNIQNSKKRKKRGIIFNRIFFLWVFKQGYPHMFFMKNTLKCKKNNKFVHNFQLILSLKYKQTIMCNYLNNYDNLNWCSLHCLQKKKKCIPYLITGACYDFFYPSTDNSKIHKGES